MFQGANTRNLGSVILVPGCTDLNRGDQALVWEGVALLQEIGFVEVRITDSGEGQEHEIQSRQTRARSYKLTRNILRHPRRGRHQQGDRVQERFVSLISLILFSLLDFVRSLAILLLAPYPRAMRLILDPSRYSSYQAFRKASAVAVKGGGFLHAYGTLADPYYIWYQLFYFRLAARMRKPIIVLPNSFGPFKGRLVKMQIRSALAKCRVITAREAVSADVLESLLGRKIPVFPDMGYYLRAAEPYTGARICREFGVPLGEQPCVAITVRPYRFPGSAHPAQAYDNYLQAVAQLVRHIDAKGFRPVFVTHVAGPSAHENDRLAIIDVQQRLSGTGYDWIDFDGDCREIKAVYGQLDYMLGTRFHSVIFAQCEGVPCMAIAYGGNKGIGIMVDMELEDYVIPIESVSGETLCTIFDLMVENSSDIKAKMECYLGYVRQSRIELMKLLTDNLKSVNS